MSTAFVEVAAFSCSFDSVRCVSIEAFLVRGDQALRSLVGDQLFPWVQIIGIALEGDRFREEATHFDTLLRSEKGDPDFLCTFDVLT